jgi:hypothetical protein
VLYTLSPLASIKGDERDTRSQRRTKKQKDRTRERERDTARRQKQRR